ncbi:hypothetical protein ACFE04_029320 [Oxalis oulophora]
MARTKKLRLSKLYSFACGKKSVLNAELAQVGGPGFSRLVYCNEPESFEAEIQNYCDNSISTTKYTLLTLVPKSLFEQFRRVANFYFLLNGILSFTPLAPFSSVSAIIPLSIVITITMIREGLEDIKRKQQDIEINNRKVKVYQNDGNFHDTQWKNLRVGDILKVQKDEYFPADLLLIGSSFDDGVCYVETMNLDGETNLKIKQALEVTLPINEDSSFHNFKATIKCEDPNTSLYTFIGSLEYEEQNYPLSPQQILLRGSKLRNTDYVYGAVIFTGHDTKVMQNATAPPSKRSRMERKMDKIVFILFLSLFIMASTGSIVFGITTRDDIDNGKMKRWYLRPDDTEIFFDPKRAPLAAIFHFFTVLMLFNYFIPISLYVSTEIAKVIQCRFIDEDVEMYYEEADKPAHARTSNLNDDLGQVDTILSDKTGTLTCNSMEFVKFSAAGTAYGCVIPEVEKAMRRRSGLEIPNGTDGRTMNGEEKMHIKGFNFEDERIMNGNWVNESRADVIHKFFQLLGVCHTVLPDVDESTGKVTYEAESPDEAAFVIAARVFGFEFNNRTQTTVSVLEFDPYSGQRVEREYKILDILEFTSARKRMSVIVRNEEGKVLVFCKGADSVMFERIGRNGREFEEPTRNHINEYADAGLRTLILAYRELDMDTYNQLNKKLREAKNSISADRDKLIEEVSEKIEKDLILLGATAVEDKLQSGVPECIEKLAQAGIKIWVLTGDKMETAINIGYACNLLRQGMKQILVTLDSPEIEAVEKAGDKAAIAKASKESIVRQLTQGKFNLIPTGRTSETFALIIDGKSLAYALEDDVKGMLLQLALGCASVICCRSSPKQKALVTRLVKTGTGKTTLAIGDGANDVGMLQEADIGIGISGAEGMQAVMSSDVAIAQFRYLERLLLVHGHWCYRRLSQMVCYFFYKNITFGFTLFLYEAHTTFSGQAAYNDWIMATYSVFFTSLPVLALGVFDQDVSARYCLKFPKLYQEGVQNVLFNWKRILGSMFNGYVCATIIFFFCNKALELQAFNIDGKTVGRDIIGVVMYTCVIFVVNLYMALSVSYFTLIQFIAVLGSVFFWFAFLLVYGSMNPAICTTAYKVFQEAVAPAPSFWFVTFFVSISTLIPYFVYSAVQRQFFPMFHEVVQMVRADEISSQGEDPEARANRVAARTNWLAERRVDSGISAHFKAGSNILKDKMRKIIKSRCHV